MLPNKILAPVFCLLLLCLASIKSLCQFPNPVPIVSIPFEYDPILHPRITLQISIDKKPPLMFILDTGLGTSIIFSDWGANQIKIPRSIIHFGSAHAGNVQSTSIKTLDFISTTNQKIQIKADRMFTGIFEEKHSLDVYGKPIAGLIGWQTFADYGMELDFTTKQLRLYPIKIIPKAFQGLVPVALEQEGLLLKVAAGLLRNNKTVDIDTGIDQTIVSWLPSNYDKMLAARLTHQGFMGQEQYEAITYLAPEFFIGSQRLLMCEIGISERQNTNVLGLDTLNCFHLFFDLPSKRLYLKPRKDKPNYDLAGSFDAALALKNHRVVVNVIRETSAAGRAGLKQGDCILKIDGIEASKYPLNLLRNLLDGTAGTVAKIEIERESSKPLTISYRRASAYDKDEGTPQTRTGIMPVKDTDGNYLIAMIQMNSSALKAGLRPGDRLVSLNEIAYTDENNARLKEIIRKSENSELKLEVLRKGKSMTFVIPPRSPKTAATK